MKLETKVERATTELNRSMKLSAEREEYEAAGDMQHRKNFYKESRLNFMAIFLYLLP